MHPLYRHHRTGLSLMELAIMLVVIGTMLGFGLQTAFNRTDKKNMDDARTELARIQRALDEFRFTNGRYPCPAPANLRQIDAGFGASVCSGGTVQIGMVPVRSLGLGDDFAADPWNNKYTYAVTADLTASDTSFDTSGAQIIIMGRDASGTDYEITSAGQRAAYVLLSHGQNQRGATPIKSTAPLGAACVGPSPIDANNCDGDGTFYDTQFNTGENSPNFNDDLIVWSVKPMSTVGGGGDGSAIPVGDSSSDGAPTP